MVAPAANKTVLENGVRILTEAMPHSRSVSMGVWVDVGARDESEAEQGLSHFIEHMIFKGTRKRSAFDIAKEFDAIGGYSNAFTGMENTCYHAKVLDSHLETMVDILSDIFLNSVFDEAEVERERAVICQEIGMLEDSPDEYLHLLAGRTWWGDHPLGRPVMGTRENVQGFSAEQIRAFFRRLYQPGRIIVSAAGHLNHDRFVDLVAPLFGTIENGGRFPRRKPALGRARVELCTRDLEQTHLCVATRGLSIADPRRYAFTLMSAILGGNMSSRLFQEIRERRGLAYSVYSFAHTYVDSGMSGACAGVEPRSAQESVRLILKALGALCEAPVGDDELRDAKEYTKGSLLLSAESNDNQMVRLAQNEFHFGRQIPLEEVVAGIEAVTAEDIQRLARHLFRPGETALTVVGPVSDAAQFEDLA